MQKQIQISSMSVLNNKTTPQAMADGVAADIVFTDADMIDSKNFHDPTVNPERFIVPVGQNGLYSIDFSVTFAAGAATDLQVSYNVNGGYNKTIKQIGNAANTVTMNITDIFLLAAGDIVKLNCKQTGVVAGLNLTGFVKLIKINDVVVQ